MSHLMRLIGVGFAIGTLGLLILVVMATPIMLAISFILGVNL